MPMFERGKRCLDGRGLTCVAWAADGQRIAVAGHTTLLEVWNVHINALCATYHRHLDIVTSIAWSPGGRYLASGSCDGTVQIWEAATGNPLYTYRRHRNEAPSTHITAVAWSPCGRYIASAGTDWTIRIWDVKTARTLQVLCAHRGAVLDVSWSCDSRHIASSGEDGLVHVWDAFALPHPLMTLPAQGHRCISAVKWSPGGNLIAFLEAGRRVHLFQVVPEAMLWCRIHGTNAALGYADEPDEEEEHCGDLAFSPDGSLLASAGDNGIPWLWDVATGTPVSELHSVDTVRTLSFHPSISSGPQYRSYLLAGSCNGTVRAWPIFLPPHASTIRRRKPD